jgi:hypothetical protein
MSRIMDTLQMFEWLLEEQAEMKAFQKKMERNQEEMNAKIDNNQTEMRSTVCALRSELEETVILK